MKIGNLQSLPWYLRLVMFVAVAGVCLRGLLVLRHQARPR